MQRTGGATLLRAAKWPPDHSIEGVHKRPRPSVTPCETLGATCGPAQRRRPDLVKRATTPTRSIDGGEVIVLQAKGKNLTHDGQRYDNDHVFVIHFEGGKIVRYEEYCGTELIARVLPDRIVAKSMPKPA